jgi:hypothetical protein
MTEENATGGDADKSFVWSNLDAWLGGELDAADRARFDSILNRCGDARAYVEAEQAFLDAVRRGMEDSRMECPEGLRSKVLQALDRCEAELADDGVLKLHPGQAAEARMNKYRFPWLFTAFASAAAVLLAVGVFMAVTAFQDTQPVGPDLPATLTPVVSSISFECEGKQGCNYLSAAEEYRKHFSRGPELPSLFGERRLPLRDFQCIEIDGRRFMCAVYDPGDEGSAFALLTFRRGCLGRSMPEPMRAAEMMVDGKLVLLWSEGEFMRALVGKPGCSKLLQHREALR